MDRATSPVAGLEAGCLRLKVSRHPVKELRSIPFGSSIPER
jgi:hypothetical protein